MKTYLISIFLFASLLSYSQERLSFNADWKFALDEQAGAESVNFDDTKWRELNLPHDWSIEGEYDKDNPSGVFCGFLPAGIGWYRKTIAVPSDWKNKYVEIAFDGIFRNSTVWANGKKLGFRPYGWVSFAYDISEIASESESITFAVRVDNEQQSAARWYTGSGIYADTWIFVRNKIHVPRDGIFIRTEGGKVLVDTEVQNRTRKRAKLILVSTVKDTEGNSLVSKSKKLSVESGELIGNSQSLELSKPHLWDVDNPYLYTLVTEVKSGKETVDRLETRFGVRDIEWIPETGMWLNGKNIKLRGVCNHQDAGALGAAVPDKILRYRIQQLKDMGCNAIRTAHNAQTPKFYEMCDEMGMMVMDEFFDGWHKKAEHDYGAHSFADWWERDLSDLIKRDRNHPSVVIYSVGNESKGDYGAALVELCHRIDPSRLVTSGHAGSEYMDVYGENGGSERNDFFDSLETDRVFIGTENVHTWHNRGFYRTKMWYRDGFPGKSGKAYYYPDLTEEEVFSYDWTDGTHRTNGKQTLRSSYDNSVIGLTVRHSIQKLRDIPNFAGTFRWAGYDYLGEVKYHGGWPFKSFSGGAIDMANFEKDLYYLYQSQWTSKPMIHILPHWTHPTLEEGTKIPVWVYSNCDEVELFLNGNSLGKKKPGKNYDEMQCEWLVPWTPGEIRAIGLINGKVEEEAVIRSADAPSKIELSVDGSPLSNMANDIVQVRVSTTDVKGEIYPYGENRTYFHVLGPGKVRALDNGSPLDKEKYYEAKSRIAFFGLTRAYIESGENNGDIALLAACILGEKKQVSSKMVSIDTGILALRGTAPESNIEVYYTTDGSKPAPSSPLYSGPFELELGKTVKALVKVNGKEAFIMEERFAEDEGFYWDSTVEPTNPGGDQAEDAKYKIAVFGESGKNFKGTGYLEFGPDSNGEGFVEWYYENDRSDGEFKLAFSYSASDKFIKKHTVILSVNDEEQIIELPAKKPYRNHWEVHEIGAVLNAGANYIRITAKDVNGLCIDELLVE